jgi:lipopolysaccharide transport system ATP-binding protein
MQPAIIVDAISKRYSLGARVGRPGQLREALLNVLGRRHADDDATTLWALRDVSFSVPPGEVVGLVGRNGAGKSTLLKVVARITHPTSGAVRVNGRISSLLEVGTGFHEELTGRENVFLNGSILGMTRKQIAARFDEIVAFSGVERFIDTPIKRYSSGMRLRLGFAVAAHLQSDILIVDEVLAVGDAEFQKKCLAAMSDLHQHGRTVLFVSHNMAAVENLCSRAVWIDGGRVRMDGPTADVITAYMASYSDAEAGDLDLSRIQHRRGSGEARFTGVRFLTPAGEHKGVIRSGDPLVIQLSYEAQKRIDAPHFGVSIHSETGAQITDTSTWAVGLDTPHLGPGRGTVTLSIDQLPLMPGRYFLSFWLEALGKVCFDGLDHCCKLDVEVADIYGSGRGIAKQFGLVFLPCRWSVDASGALS